VRHAAQIYRPVTDRRISSLNDYLNSTRCILHDFAFGFNKISIYIYSRRTAYIVYTRWTISSTSHSSYLLRFILARSRSLSREDIRYTPHKSCLCTPIIMHFLFIFLFYFSSVNRYLRQTNKAAARAKSTGVNAFRTGLYARTYAYTTCPENLSPAAAAAR